MNITQKMIDANRLNAQKSTGPKTAAGKSVSSQNRFKHGLYAQKNIIDSLHLKEDPAEYEELLNSLIEELKPQTAFQRLLVCKIANALWRSRRIVGAETADINYQINDLDLNKFYFRGYGWVKISDESDRESARNPFERPEPESVARDGRAIILDILDPRAGGPTDNEIRRGLLGNEGKSADEVGIPRELIERKIDNIISLHSMPFESNVGRFGIYEMRLDRQIFRCYKLLRMLQLEQKANSLLNHNNEIKND